LLAHAEDLGDINNSKELRVHPSPPSIPKEAIADPMKVKPEPRNDEKKPTKNPG
jgi:hypothetical protein